LLQAQGIGGDMTILRRRVERYCDLLCLNVFMEDVQRVPQHHVRVDVAKAQDKLAFGNPG
jgi:hypothetical protein